jgi:hypothetical protein
VRIPILVSEEVAAVDAWRAAQPGLSPTRSDTIRELVLWAIKHYPKKTPLKGGRQDK